MKMLEYVVTVVNCIPFQELCSLSALMQGLFLVSLHSLSFLLYFSSVFLSFARNR